MKGHLPGAHHSSLAESSKIRSMVKALTHPSVKDTSFAQHQEWRKNHKDLETTMNIDKGKLDELLDNNLQEEDSCFAQLLENKHLLDGLSGRVSELNSQNEAEINKLAAATLALETANNSMIAASEEYDTANAKCKELHNKKQQDHDQLQSELDELGQIAASSSVQKTAEAVATVEDAAKPEDEGVDEGEGTESSLMEVHQASFSKQSCMAIVELTKRNKRHMEASGFADPPASEEICETEHVELQKVFSSAVISIRAALVKASESLQDTSCFDTATAVFNSASEPLTAEMLKARKDISDSNSRIAELKPPLEALRLEVARIEKIIEKLQISSECESIAQASQWLQAVQKLIISMSKCGGRSFELTMPDENATIKTTTPTPAMTFKLVGNGWCMNQDGHRVKAEKAKEEGCYGSEGFLSYGHCWKKVDGTLDGTRITDGSSPDCEQMCAEDPDCDGYMTEDHSSKCVTIDKTDPYEPPDTEDPETGLGADDEPRNYCWVKQGTR